MTSQTRSVRATTLLGPNTVDGLARVVDHLNRRGHSVELVDCDPADVVERRVEIDLLWACGLLTAQLVDQGHEFTVVAAPIFPGETEPVYRSVIVARAGDEVPGRRLAINEHGSWSGYRALFHDAAVRSLRRWNPEDMDENVVTGAHVESLAAVADGRADVAAIDHSIWDWLVATDHAAVDGLTVIDTTVDCPAPPFSVSGDSSSASRTRLVADLLAHDSAPALVPATIDNYRFMLSA